MCYVMHLLSLVVVALLIFFIIWLFSGSRNNYTNLGDVYKGGDRGEFNEECLEHPGQRLCMLSDGTSGVCVLSGRCVSDMLVDHRRENDNAPRPLCTAPVFKEGCQRRCRCKGMNGEACPGCMGECMSWFSPM